MQDINRGFLVGRMARDAEVKYTASGIGMITGAVACGASVKKPDGTWGDEGHFFDFVYWLGRDGSPKLAEYLKKGKQVAIEYRLHQDRWEDKETGKNRSKVTLFIREIQLIGGEPGANRGPKDEDRTPPAWAGKPAAAPAGNASSAPAPAQQQTTFTADGWDNQPPPDYRPQHPDAAPMARPAYAPAARPDGTEPEIF